MSGKASTLATLQTIGGASPERALRILAVRQGPARPKPAKTPKTCLGCGAKFTTIPEGGLPCGH